MAYYYTNRDLLQVAAFRAVYRQLNIRDPIERFATAIALTSDDRFEQVMRDRPGAIKKWLEKYGQSDENGQKTFDKVLGWW